MGTPLTVIGGFLGAGKTTLLNHVLGNARGVRYAVLVNDFGEIALDDRLVVEHGGDTVTFANGCVCCTLGDSLLDTVDRLLAAEPPPDQFLVEASGVADPTAIADLATLHPDLRRDLVIVLCDAATVRERAADERMADTVERQLAAADALILNHSDGVDAAALAGAREWLRERTGLDAIVATRAVLDLRILDATVPRSRERAAGDDAAARAAHPFHTRVVHGALRSGVAALRERLSTLGPDVLRAKGMLREVDDPGRWWLVQVVAGRMEISRADDLASAGVESALVLLSAGPLPDEAAIARDLGLEPPGPVLASRPDKS